MACDRSPGEGEGRGWRPLTRGCHEVTGDHAPPGQSPQVTGGGQTGFPEEIINVSVMDSKHKFVELTLK